MLETRYIPKLGRSVTRLGLGALPMGPLQRKLTPHDGGEVVRAAVANGITFIDTATMYGTYEHIAQGLRGWNGTVTIATKTHAGKDRSMAREHVEKALKGLGRDRIDIMLCHCARSAFTEELWGPSLEALVSAREKGTIGMVGISTHSIQSVRDAARHPEIDVIHPLINIKGMGIIDGTTDQMLEAIGEAHAAGKFIYAMKSLAGGNFVPDREKAFRFVFDRKEIDAVMVGMVTPLEVEDVLGRSHVVIPARSIKGESRWKLFGKTASGRNLVVVFTIRRKLFRAVTAYEMNAADRRKYAPQID